MSDMIRIFFAHPKGMDDAVIDSWSSRIRASFESDGFNPVEVVTGRDDFTRYAAGAGGFSAWAREVAVRRDRDRSGTYYDVIVSVNTYIGRATADICSVALNTQLPVILFENGPDNTLVFKPVAQVVVVDPKDYINGWCLDT